MHPLSVEQFAEMRALLDAGRSREVVLQAHELDGARWREEEERILADLADAADVDALLAYQRIYRATWHRVVGEPVEEHAHVLDPEPQADSLGAVAAPVVVQTPTFVRQAEASRAEAPVRSPMVARAPRAQMETATMDLQSILAAVRGAAVPFEDRDARAQASSVVAPVTGPRTSQTKAELRVDSGTMINTDLSAMVAAAQAGKLPFQGKREALADAANPWRSAPDVGARAGAFGGDARLPLEVYASITAALASGEERSAVFARHGVTGDAFAQQARAWGARLQDDPALLARFKELARGGMAR